MSFYEFSISTNKSEELIDITDEIESIISRANAKDGIVHIFIPHATAGIILNESADPNIKTDFLNALERAIPKRANYLHDRIDRNASAHIRSAIVGSSLTIPLRNGRMVLGTWQSIMFCEFDGPRTTRRIIVQILENA
uniref:YjbQ family protein n=1 Tax=candidate division WOR-3 bacterium TaxID=2052148 RepID=A0A7V0Z4H8_UNCW3